MRILLVCGKSRGKKPEQANRNQEQSHAYRNYPHIPFGSGRLRRTVCAADLSGHKALFTHLFDPMRNLL